MYYFFLTFPPLSLIHPLFYLFCHPTLYSHFIITYPFHPFPPSLACQSLQTMCVCVSVTDKESSSSFFPQSCRRLAGQTGSFTFQTNTEPEAAPPHKRNKGKKEEEGEEKVHHLIKKSLNCHLLRILDTYIFF